MTEELFKPPYEPSISPDDIPVVPPPVIVPEVVIPTPITAPPPPPPPIEANPVNEIELESTTDTSYSPVITLTPSYGKVILLKEISIAPLTSDSATYGRWFLKIDDRQWGEIELGSTLTIPYDWKTYAKKEIKIMHRTINSSYEVKTNAMVVGVECREEDVKKIRGFYGRSK